MAKGDFTTAKEAAILGGDYGDAVFGTVAISNHDYICAIDIGNNILILDSDNVSFFTILKKKGMSRKAANLIGATTHAVISTMVPGASLIGAIAGNTAAAAAGVATSGAAAHVAGGIRDYRDIIVVFRDQKKCIIRCSDLYFKKIKKCCEERKLSEYEIDKLLNIKSEPTSPKNSSKNRVEKEQNQKPKISKSQPSSNTYHQAALDKKEISSKVRVCPKCKKEISDGDKYCSGCGIKIETAILKCYNCGHKLKANDSYCPSCGHPIKEVGAKRVRSAYIDAHGSSQVEGKKLKKKKSTSKLVVLIPMTLAVLLIGLLIYIFNPPHAVIQWRLGRVLDLCEKNEESQECKNIQSIYKISYNYCHAYFDIPEIGKTIPVYGVATRNIFRGDSLTVLRSYSDNNNVKISPYYGCVANYADLDLKDGILHETTQESQATYWLRDRPSISFSLEKCTITKRAFNSVLWRNIPNWGKITWEETDAYLRYDGECVKGMEIELKKTDNKLEKYSNNTVVQEYYAGFDVWNESLHSNESCTYGDETTGEIKFRGRCLTTVGKKGYPMVGFVDFMNDRRSSIYYDSKLISQ